MNKRGQFYILAAILIVVVLTGITTMSTYTVIKTKSRTIESMGKELKEEGYRIIDYAMVNNQPSSEVKPFEELNDFTENYYQEYFLTKTDNASIIFIYGNKSNLYATNYDTISAGSIRATLGNIGPTWGIVSGFVNRTTLATPLNPASSIKVVLFDKNYNLELKDNEMFYFAIMQEKEGERYIEKDI